MLSMNAFVFFNGGFEAGASIMHKHLQAIPLESMNVPIVKAVENHLLTDDQEELEYLFQLPQF